MHALLLAPDRRCLEVIGGLSAIDRLIRTLRDARIGPIAVLARTGTQGPYELIQALAGREVTVVAIDEPLDLAQLAALWPESDLGLIASADLLLDRRIAIALAATKVPTALVDSAPPEISRRLAEGHHARGALVCGSAVLNRRSLTLDDNGVPGLIARGLEAGQLSPLDIDHLPVYSGGLRRSLRPWWFRAPQTPADRVQVERRLVDATKKGAPDIPALFHSPVERVIVAWLAPGSVTPNQVTVVTTIVAWCATLCFATGRLGVGLAAALAVGVLDGVDGRLARLKLQTSRLGELEHYLDAAYETSWWLSLAHWFYSSGILPNAWILAAMLFGMEAIDGVAKLGVIRATGRTIDETSTLDRAVRLVGGRRNVYVWIMATGYLVGVPASAYALLPFWEAATVAIHLPRAAWIVHERRALSGTTDLGKEG